MRFCLEAWCNYSHSITDAKVVSKSPKNAIFQSFDSTVPVGIFQHVSSFHPPDPLETWKLHHHPGETKLFLARLRQVDKEDFVRELAVGITEKSDSPNPNRRISVEEVELRLAALAGAVKKELQNLQVSQPVLMGLQDVMYKSGWLERWMVILCYICWFIIIYHGLIPWEPATFIFSRYRPYL